MPFELGIAYGIGLAESVDGSTARLLVIAEHKYKYQAALSDIAGWDIQAHGTRFEDAIKHVRSWLASHGLTDRSTSGIIGEYVGFQEWDYERLLAQGWQDTDIQERSTPELIGAMLDWLDAGSPVTFN